MCLCVSVPTGVREREPEGSGGLLTPPQPGGGGGRALGSSVRRPSGIPSSARGHAREKFIEGARGCQRAAGSEAGRCGAREHRSPLLGGNNRWARRGGRCRRGAGGDAGSARAGQRRSVLLGTRRGSGGRGWSGGISLSALEVGQGAGTGIAAQGGQNKSKK